MSSRRLVAIVLVAALAAGAVGAGMVLLLRPTTKSEQAAGSGATAGKQPFKATPSQVKDDIGSALAVEIGGSSWTVDSAACNAADSSGLRFRCRIYMQGGIIVNGGDPAASDNGIGARYGLAQTQGGQGVNMTVSYSADGAQLSWSPGGGSALTADVRQRRAEIAAALKRNQEEAQAMQQTQSQESGPGAGAGTSGGDGKEVKCGTVVAPQTDAPLPLTGAGMSCDEMRRVAIAYMKTGKKPPGFDDCAADSASCNRGTAYFRVG